MVRDRARDLERNDNLARKYLAMIEANIVGRGFQLTLSGDAEIQHKFLAWAERADVRELLSFPDLQRLVARSAARDGDLFVRLLRGSQYADGLALQVLEGDYVNHAFNEWRGGDGGVVMGVELDALGREVAAYFSDRHPGTGLYDYSIGQARRVSAKDYIHVFRQERPGQARAVSWMASAMQAIRMLHGYQEAELVAARIGSCKMGFYKIPPGEDFTADGMDADTGAPISDAAPGVFERLPTGWDFQSFTPEHPTSQYGQFVKDLKRDIAGGLQVAYNNLANDLEGVSYSSIRSGTIEEREQWIVLQDWFSRAFLRRVFAEWLETATLAGTISLKQADAVRGKDKWSGRRWPWVDPRADIDAKQTEVALGLTSPSIIAAERGDDFLKIQNQLAADNKLRESLGLAPISEKPNIAAGKKDG